MKVFIVQDTFSGNYAGHSMTEWVRRGDDAIHFTDRKRAEAHAARIAKAPRQFAGLGQKTRIVEFELGGKS